MYMHVHERMLIRVHVRECKCVYVHESVCGCARLPMSLHIYRYTFAHVCQPTRACRFAC